MNRMNRLAMRPPVYMFVIAGLLIALIVTKGGEHDTDVYVCGGRVSTPVLLTRREMEGRSTYVFAQLNGKDIAINRESLWWCRKLEKETLIEKQ